MSEKYAFIGDIHGDYYSLDQLLLKIPKDRIFVFLGDYINFGLHSRRVIDKLLSLKEQTECVFLLGNHEFYFEEFVNNRISFFQFAKIGGIPTIKSYLKGKAIGDIVEALKENLPNSHQEFFSNLNLYLETNNFLASHSGINYENPNSRFKKDLIHNTELLKQELVSKKKIICGHFIQERNIPLLRNNLVCIDTGCGVRGGPLSAYLYPEDVVLQSTNNANIP